MDCEESKSPLFSVNGLLAVLVCDKCERYHRAQLGTKPKSIDECSHKDLELVNNALVNQYYEVVNFDMDKDKITSQDNDQRRATFIQHKYRDCKFRNDVSLEMALTNTRMRSSSASNRSPSSVKLRNFLSPLLGCKSAVKVCTGSA